MGRSEVGPGYYDHIYDTPHWHVFSAHDDYYDWRSKHRVRHRIRGWLLRDVVVAIARELFRAAKDMRP